MSAGEASCSIVWTKEEDKAFENAIASYPEDTSDRWEKIGERVPGKTLEEIKNHYSVLVDDVSRIESGCVPLPAYNSSCSDSSGNGGDEGTSKRGGSFGQNDGESHHGIKSSRTEQERRKGIAWTEEEHRLFLLGLDKYGKGDWRSISRNFVVTRTPTQVASHAQKYFIRLNAMNKDRRRSSIHDITSATGDAAALPTSAAPKQPQHHVGQPAVGTPVALPPYGRAPLAYQMPPTSAHR